MTIPHFIPLKPVPQGTQPAVLSDIITSVSSLFSQSLSWLSSPPNPKIWR